jgi:adenylate cyclase
VADRWTRARAALGRAGADARHLNSRPEVVERVRRFRRALPGDPGFGDPLTIAGRDPAATLARLGDRVFTDEPRLTRELRMSGLQVWQAALDRTGRGRGDRELTILFTDLVGFSSWALQAGDDEALQLLRAVSRAVEPPVLEARGKIVKRLGDGMMAVFPGPQLAFDAACAGLGRAAGIEVAGFRPQLRYGLHTGRPRPLGGDYLGVDVNVAARVMQAAAGGEIMVSDSTLAGLDPERVVAKRRRPFRLKAVKGVPDEVTFHSVTARS